MNTTQLQCFLEACKWGSFNKAAQALYMTQPTFGRQIAALEDELGLLLFQRGKQGISLTPVGNLLFDRFSAVYAGLQDAIAQAKRLESGGTLTLGLLDGQLMDQKLQQTMLLFQQQNPMTELRLDRCGFHQLIERVRSRQVDIGFTLTLDAEVQAGLEHLEYIRLENYLVLSKSHPLAKRKAPVFIDFAEDVFIDIDPKESASVSHLIIHTCKKAGFEPKLLTVPDLKAQILYLEANRGITAFNEMHMTCHNPNFVALSLPEFSPVGFSAVWNPANELRPTKEFLALLRQV